VIPASLDGSARRPPSDRLTHERRRPPIISASTSSTSRCRPVGPSGMNAPVNPAASPAHPPISNHHESTWSPIGRGRQMACPIHRGIVAGHRSMVGRTIEPTSDGEGHALYRHSRVQPWTSTAVANSSGMPIPRPTIVNTRRCEPSSSIGSRRLTSLTNTAIPTAASDIWSISSGPRSVRISLPPSSEAEGRQAIAHRCRPTDPTVNVLGCRRPNPLVPGDDDAAGNPYRGPLCLLAAPGPTGL
jgi:hypothetical protein